MKIELAFNESTFSQQQNLHFDTYWAEFLKSNRQRLIWTALAAFLGGILLYDGNELGWLAFGIGFMIFINFERSLMQYKDAKKRYEAKVEGLKEEFIRAESHSYCELEEEHFIMVYPAFESKIKWTYFEGYRIIQDTLFLDMDLATGQSVMISRAEVNENEWLALKEKVSRELDDLLLSSE